MGSADAQRRLLDWRWEGPWLAAGDGGVTVRMRGVQGEDLVGWRVGLVL